jgi:hypothetical protein
MLIIYGVKSKPKTLGMVNSEPCDNCRNTSYFYYAIQKYFHIFYIPFISAGRKKLLICSGCNKDYEKNTLSPNKLADIQNSGLKSSSVLPYFTGLILSAIFLLFIIVFSSISGNTAAKNTDLYFNNPKVGDYYILHDENSDILFSETTTGSKNYKYNVLEISNIDGEKYTFKLSTNLYLTSSDAQESISTEGSNASYFIEDQVEFTKSEITNYKNSGLIKIIRN